MAQQPGRDKTEPDGTSIEPEVEEEKARNVQDNLNAWPRNSHLAKAFSLTITTSDSLTTVHYK